MKRLFFVLTVCLFAGNLLQAVIELNDGKIHTYGETDITIDEIIVSNDSTLRIVNLANVRINKIVVINGSLLTEKLPGGMGELTVMRLSDHASDAKRAIRIGYWNI